MPRDEQDIVIGRFIAPFGTRGEVKTIVLTDFPERFERGNTLRALVDDKIRELKVASCRAHLNGLVLKLEGVDTRSDAEELRGVDLVIGPDELGELDQGSFYVFDLIGLKVVTDDGREQGVVTEVMQGGGNDVYITSTGLCIPALKDVVTKVDVQNGTMTIHPVPGLLPGE